MQSENRGAGSLRQANPGSIRLPGACTQRPIMFPPLGVEVPEAGQGESLNKGGLYTGQQSQQETVDQVWASIHKRASSTIADGGDGGGKKISEIFSAAGGEGPALSSTGPLSRQGRETGGEDTAEIAVFGHWRPELFERVTCQLAQMRQTAEAGTAAVFAVAGEGLVMQASGARVGAYYRWVMEWACGRLYVIDRCGSSDKLAGVRVTFESLPLMTWGLDACWSRLCTLLERWGFVIEWNQVSRIDMATDLPGQAVGPFLQAAIEGQYVTRGTVEALRREEREWSSWTVGEGGPVMMRIYDKLREVKAKQDWAKLAVLVEKRWGGVEPACATRVEFQLRRECLRERWQVSSIEDYKAKRRQIAEWLTDGGDDQSPRGWFRLVEGVSKEVRENRNQTRCATLPLWVRVREALCEWVGRNTIAAVVPRKVLRPSIVSMGKQISGCVTSVTAMLGRVPGSLDELVREGGDLIRMYGLAAWQGAAVKAARFEALRGALLQPSMEGG